MSYTIKTKVVTTIDVQFDRFSIGNSFAEKINPFVESCTFSAYGDETTIILKVAEHSHLPALWQLIDRFAKEAVMEAR